MVLKTAKSGVYSGNTLRASNSSYSRRYHKQGCIVKKIVNQTEAPQTFIKQLLTDFEASSFGVEFSLNKKARWGLPDTLRKDIVEERDALDETDVKTDLLLRHKLKRQSNCVAYYSSKGPLPQLVPQDGRYFNGRSATEFKTKSKQTTPSDEGETVPLEPTVRYEVFYPCKKSSSIAHNLKYIHPEATGTNLGNKRNKKRRVRLNSKDVKEMIEYDDPVTYNEQAEFEVLSSDDSSEADNSLYQFTLGDFMKTEKNKVKRKSRRRDSDRSESSSNKKGRLIYEEPQGGSKNSSVAATPVENEHVSTTVIADATELCPVPVKIDVSEVAFDTLQSRFGKAYLEARCERRKFALDITDEVKCHIRNYGMFRDIVPSLLDIHSYLLFADQGSAENEPQCRVYQVVLNFACNMKSIKIESLNELEIYTVDEIITRTLVFLNSLPREAFCVRKVNDMYGERSMTFQILDKVKNLNVCILHPSDFAAASPLGISNTGVPLPVSDPQYCNICYEELRKEDDIDVNKVSGTCLDSCGHWFCDSCWREHLVHKLHSGFCNFTCPEYECNMAIDFPTFLHFLHISDIKKHIERKMTENINVSPNAKWCPMPRCGRAILTDEATEKNINVVCRCDTDLCFVCMKNAHWPASCKQAVLFREKVIANKDYINLPKDFFLDPLPDAVLIQGKSCPKCKRFIEKISGCPNMRCPCGTNFCWTCVKITKPYEPHTCIQEEEREKLLEEFTSDHNNSGKSKYYAIALEHRQLRLPSNFARLRSGCFVISKHIFRLAGRNSLVRQQIADLPRQDDSTVQNTTRKYMMQMLSVKMELHHVIENLAVLLDFEVGETRRSKLNPCLSNMVTCAANIGETFEMKQNQDLTAVLSTLKRYYETAQKTISRVCRIVGKSL